MIEARASDSSESHNSGKYELHSPQAIAEKAKKAGKGAWRMPWLTEAMKDVISCDKPRVGANDL